MRSVAQGRFAAVFAGAKEHLAGFCCGVFHGLIFGVFVASIAKRLLCAFAAGAPKVIFAFLNLNRHRGFLYDNWGSHRSLL